MRPFSNTAHMLAWPNAPSELHRAKQSSQPWWQSQQVRQKKDGEKCCLSSNFTGGGWGVGKRRPSAAKYDFQAFPTGLQTRGLTASWCLMGTWVELFTISSSLLSYGTILAKEGDMNGSAPGLSLRFGNKRRTQWLVEMRPEDQAGFEQDCPFCLVLQWKKPLSAVNFCVLPGICLHDTIFNIITIVACFRLQISCTFYLHTLLLSDPTCRKANSKIE